MKKHEERDFHKKTKTANSVTEDIIYDKLFVVKTSNQEHGRKTFIADCGATSYMVKPK